MLKTKTRPGRWLKTSNAFGQNYADPPGAERWLYAVNSRGGSVSDAQMRRVDNLLRELDDCGALSRLSRLFLHASENWYQATADAITGGVAIPDTGTPWFKGRGFGADTHGQGVDLNAEPTDAPALYTEASASYGGWTLPRQGVPLYAGFYVGNRIAADDLRLYVNGEPPAKIATTPALPWPPGDKFRASANALDAFTASYPTVPPVSTIAAVSFFGAGLDDVARAGMADALAKYLAAFGVQ
jgi:hypothetical protein